MSHTTTLPSEAGAISTVVVGPPADHSHAQFDEQATVENLTAVEDLLDWLESHGVVNRTVVALDDSSFLVSWQSVSSV